MQKLTAEVAEFYAKNAEIFSALSASSLRSLR